MPDRGIWHEAGRRRSFAGSGRDTPISLSPFCHRGYVSAWLHDEVGLEIYEFGREGCGHQHPKLPEAHRSGLVQPRLI
ncbi:MAG: hypothetical protein E5V22_10415 [Mesorhizobium sp.]|uniref:hypothetical protein n=1 Tax=Mesorhizobium sp. M5C.F.Ca.IN.020.29.1.1 TaxID=2496770 RepID=UPI000FCAAC82|nr:hypothetical protein [Mesorhizobium sp. M5C.F.Ca.IN.020.29.1.1]TIY04673.1 MAG: hypothetical protein E5V22_10415 [Mesorhizobium sp.]